MRFPIDRSLLHYKYGIFFLMKKKKGSHRTNGSLYNRRTNFFMWESCHLPSVIIIIAKWFLFRFLQRSPHFPYPFRIVCLIPALEQFLRLACADARIF